MSPTELLEEVRWLLSAGVHPLLICDELERKPSGIYSAACKAQDTTVMAAFGGYQRVRINPRKKN